MSVADEKTTELLAGLRSYAAILRRMAKAHEEAAELVAQGNNALAVDQLLNFACGLPPNHDDTVVGWIKTLGGTGQAYAAHLSRKA